MNQLAQQCIANGFDIFCSGVVLGGASVLIGQWAIKLLDLWLGNNQKKLDLELGKALAKMRERQAPPQNLFADESLRKALKQCWYEGVAVDNFKVGDPVLYNAATGHTKMRSS